MSKTKKIIILCSMVALLVVTGVLNVVLNKQPATDANAGKDAAYSDFFSGYRTDRLATRNQSIDYLDAIIESASSTQEAVAEAQTKKLELVDMMEKELVLEGLIKSLGYADCIVTLGTDNVNCILKTAELDETQVAQVLSTLVTETGTAPTGIKIIPVE